MYYRSYVDRLELLNLCSLEMRRIKNDLIMCFKFLKNLVDVNMNDFFILSGVTHTRGNPLKLKKSCVANVSSSSLGYSITELSIYGMRCLTILFVVLL